MQHQKNNKQSLTQRLRNENEEQRQVNKLGMLLGAVEKQRMRAFLRDESRS